MFTASASIPRARSSPRARAAAVSPSPVNRAFSLTAEQQSRDIYLFTLTPQDLQGQHVLKYLLDPGDGTQPREITLSEYDSQNDVPQQALYTFSGANAWNVSATALLD